MQHHFTLCTLLFMFWIGSHSVVGQLENSHRSAISTDRPSVSAGTAILPKHSVQVETGLLLDRLDLDQAVSEVTNLPNGMLRWSLLEQVELRLSSAYRNNTLRQNAEKIAEIQGLDDVTLGTKFYIRNKPEKDFTYSGLIQFTLPTSKSGVGNERIIVNPILLISTSLWKKSSLLMNVGWKNSEIEGTGDLDFSAMFSASFGRHFGYYLELYGSFNQFETLSIGGDGGLNWIPYPSFQVDLAAGMAFDSPTQYIITLGFSFLLEALY
jgi:hypothetical protein